MDNCGIILKQNSELTNRICFCALFQKNGNLELEKKILIESKEIIEYKANNQSLFVKYNGKLSNDLESFIRSGVITIPILSKSELKGIQNEFLTTLKNFPEYNEGNNIYVLGGFSALGNPASFHNPLVRKLRLLCYNKCKSFFRELINTYYSKKLKKNYKLEMLFDRMMYRLKGNKPTAESWHRDVTPKKLIEEDDEIFGGWINLDSQSQYFSCIPGSHLGVKLYDLQSGFATLEKYLKDSDINPKNEFVKINKMKTLFEVPPGHIVIFPQYILHEVVSNAAKYDMMRLFIGWRLTRSKDSIYNNLEEIISSQGVPILPSGQQIPMYSKSHMSYFLHKKFNIGNNTKMSVIEWSKKTFKSQLLVNKKDYQIIPRIMTDLRKYKLPMYDKYREEEINILIPSKI